MKYLPILGLIYLLLVAPTDIPVYYHNDDSVTQFGDNTFNLYKNSRISEMGLDNSLFYKNIETGVNSPWNLEMLNYTQIWNITSGSEDITVAVLDSSIDFNHELLYHSQWINKNEIANTVSDDDRNGYVDDYKGWDFVDDNNDPTSGDYKLHGTHVAGIIAAKEYGLAPDVKVMALRVLNDNDFALWSDVEEAVYYAINNGADVINLSIVGKSMSFGLYTALESAVANNVAVVISSGNDGKDVTSEIHFPNRISTPEGVFIIGNIMLTKNIHPSSTYGDHIDFVAPGTNILSTTPFNNTGTLTGTSMAAPHVSATIALMKSIKPDLTLSEIYLILQRTAVDLGEPGWNNIYGHGLINPLRSLNVLQDVTDPHINGTIKIGSMEDNLGVLLNLTMIDDVELHRVKASVLFGFGEEVEILNQDILGTNFELVEFYNTGKLIENKLYPINISIQVWDLNNNSFVLHEVFEFNSINYIFWGVIILIPSLIATGLLIFKRIRKSKTINNFKGESADLD
jgi:hypothetical protein